MVCLETSFRLDGRFLRFFVLRSFVDEIDEDEDEHESAGEGGGEARLPRRRLPTDDERSRLPAFILSTGLMAMVDVEDDGEKEKRGRRGWCEWGDHA